jgi:hypothetical protein
MSKLRYAEIKARANEFIALTSLTVDEFELLVPHFEQAFQAHMSKWCLDGRLRTKRRYTTYANCPLATAEDRLLFVLSYVKGNPLQSVHGMLFGLVQCKTNTWLHVLLPVLRTALRELQLAPCRSVTELTQRLGLTLLFEGNGATVGAAKLPLFAMTPPNDPLSVPKLSQNRRRAIAARNMVTR